MPSTTIHQTAVPTKLTIISSNVNSLKHRIPLIAAWLHAERIDAFLCQETKLSTVNLDAEVQIEGYTFFREDRKFKNGGGGVGLFVKNSLRPVAVKLYVPDTVECVACKLSFNGADILLVSAYRSPTGSTVQNEDDFVSSMSDAISRAIPQESSLVLGGDLNLDSYDDRQSQVIKFLNDQLGTKQIISLDNPTHKKSHIDHLYVRNLTVLSEGIARNVEKHHMSVRAVLSVGRKNTKSLDSPQSFIWRNWDDTDWNALE